MKDYGDKLSAEDKKTIEDDLAALKMAKEARDLTNIENAKMKLINSVKGIYAAMQEAQKQEPAQEAPEENSGDAPFEEVN